MPDESQIILEAEEVCRTARRRLDLSLRSLELALDSLSGFRGRKSLFLVSEGFILAPGMPAYERVMALARTANVAVHFLDPRGLSSGFGAQGGAPSHFGYYRLRELAGSEDIAEATGGGETLAGNDLALDLGRIADQTNAYYLVGYSPTQTGRGERKPVVRVRRDGLTLRSRSRYFVLPPVAAAAPDAQPSLATSTRSLRSVSDATELHLLASALQFDAAADGNVNVTAAVEIAGIERTRVRLAVEARQLGDAPPVREEIASDVGAGPAVLSRNWRLAPGLWQAHFLVRDERGGRLGSAVHTFEVRQPIGLRLSTPILTDAIEGQGSTARPRLRLSREWRPGGPWGPRQGTTGADEGQAEPKPEEVVA